MRSDLVFCAISRVPNRFMLTQLASKAVRKLHRPGTRMQDTANSVFAHFSFSNPLREKQVECSNLSIVRMPKVRPRVRNASDDPSGPLIITNHDSSKSVLVLPYMDENASTEKPELEFQQGWGRSLPEHDSHFVAHLSHPGIPVSPY